MSRYDQNIAQRRSTAIEACTRVNESKGLSKHINMDLLAELLDHSFLETANGEKNSSSNLIKGLWSAIRDVHIFHWLNMYGAL